MTAKPIVYSDHAVFEMERRELQPSWVEITIRNPTLVEADPKDDRTRAWRRIDELDGRWLRVIYTETNDQIRIITAFLDRRRKP